MTFSIIKRETTAKDRLQAAVGVQGTPSGRLAGGFIDDMAALGKAIVLCETDARKFNAKSYGYRAKDLWPGQKFVMGDCDACGRMCQGTLFVKED